MFRPKISEDVCKALMCAYHNSLGTGKTHAMLHGLRSSDRNIILVDLTTKGAQNALSLIFGENYDKNKYTGVGITSHNLHATLAGRGRDTVLVLEPCVVELLVEELYHMKYKESQAITVKEVI